MLSPVHGIFRAKYDGKTQAPPGTEGDPAAAEAAAAAATDGSTPDDGDASDVEEEEMTAPDQSNLRRDGTRPKSGPGAKHTPVKPLWCLDTEGQKVALHETDVVFIAYETVLWYLYLDRCAMPVWCPDPDANSY